MLDWALILIGLGIGIAVAAPTGPVNIMIIHRGVRGGFLPALTAGMGAALGDGLYAAVAAFGMTAVADTIEGHLGLVKLVGGILLIAFGVNLVWQTPSADSGIENDTGLSNAGAAVAAFVLAVTNPALLFGFVAIFSGLDEMDRGPENYVEAAILTVSVIAGSLIWWLFLATIVTRFRARITGPRLHSINAVAGAALAGFGGLVLADLVFQIL